jgi:hypothetical protein
MSLMTLSTLPAGRMSRNRPRRRPFRAGCEQLAPEAPPECRNPAALLTSDCGKQQAALRFE